MEVVPTPKNIKDWTKEKDMVVSSERRAFGVFSNRKEAEQTLSELKTSGFPMDNVSIIARDAQQGEELGGAEVTPRIGNKDVGGATGVVGEIATDSALGAVLVGLGSLAIPGVGPIIAAGSVATALVATVASTGVEAAAIGGLVRALTDLGIPEEQARVYSDRLHQGHYLVIVDGKEDEINRAESIFSNRGIQDWSVCNSPQS
ncbi:MAG TPA: general stress protein [Coleofasciculaceae cyanobacterium]